ncbi:hypothetical protein [Pseudonocardia sp. GCM10023141]|uniref:hypothetical protein n=1 Tax=Pseudonocardia sp. GCM10023141 TaxID=3252653 RepID=UPI00361A6FCA
MWVHHLLIRSTNSACIDKHIRSLIGTVKIAELDARTFDSFHAELRRCRNHCASSWA